MISVAIELGGVEPNPKITLSRKAAEKLGYIYVDTGALYRTVGLKFSRIGADTELNCDINEVLETTQVDLRYVDGAQRVFLDGEDVSDLIRSPEASMMASAVSAKPEVREFLLEMQRKLARENNVLMDGRDIGTVVLPNATVKIYLTASAEARAKRRYEELCEKGVAVTYEDVYNDMIQRDYNDMNRKTAPLKQAPDAVLADTSGNTFEQSLELILKINKEGLESK